MFQKKLPSLTEQDLKELLVALIKPFIKVMPPSQRWAVTQNQREKRFAFAGSVRLELCKLNEEVENTELIERYTRLKEDEQELSDLLAYFPAIFRLVRKKEKETCFVLLKVFPPENGLSASTVGEALGLREETFNPDIFRAHILVQARDKSYNKLKDIRESIKNSLGIKNSKKTIQRAIQSYSLGSELEKKLADSRRLKEPEDALAEWADLGAGPLSYSNQLHELTKLAREEPWVRQSGKNDQSEFPDLDKYLKFTFWRLVEETADGLDKIKMTDREAVFNTGLLDRQTYDPIYAYFEKNSDPKIDQDWSFKYFISSSNRPDLIKRLEAELYTLPARATYCQHKSDLVFESASPPRIADHASYDRLDRFPPRVLKEFLPKFVFIEGDVADLKKKEVMEYSQKIKDALEADGRLDKFKEHFEECVELSFKLSQAYQGWAIPSYNPKDPVPNQFYLPVPCLPGQDNEIDVVLVIITDVGGGYVGVTVYDLDMAYVDARLVSGHLSNWLVFRKLAIYKEEKKKEEAKDNELKKFKADVKRGAEAEYRLGCAYDEGWVDGGGGRGPRKALEHWTGAAQKGNAEAQFKLFQIFDPPEYNFSIDDGPAPSVEEIWENNHDRLVKTDEVRRAAVYGVVPHAEKAFHHLREAAENGHPKAQFQLGEIYSRGDFRNYSIGELTQDKAAAAGWFKKVVEQDPGKVEDEILCRASKWLGDTCFSDQDVEKAQIQAWWVQAAELGDWEAGCSLLEHFPDYPRSPEVKKRMVEKVEEFHKTIAQLRENENKFQEWKEAPPRNFEIFWAGGYGGWYYDRELFDNYEAMWEAEEDIRSLTDVLRKLSQAYEHGFGVEQGPEKALELKRELYLRGAFGEWLDVSMRPYEEKVFSEFHRAEEGQDQEAEARKWEEIIESKLVSSESRGQAMFKLGMAYYYFPQKNGSENDPENDRNKALQWWLKAYRLEDYQAGKWWRKAYQDEEICYPEWHSEVGEKLKEHFPDIYREEERRKKAARVKVHQNTIELIEPEMAEGELLDKAAAMTLSEAFYVVGYDYYCKGESEENREKARECWLKAYELGNVHAERKLKKHFPGDYCGREVEECQKIFKQDAK